MRTFKRLLFALAMAAAIVGCVAPTSTPPVDAASDGPATELPTFRVPGSSLKPGQPNPTIEIPPPIY